MIQGHRERIESGSEATIIDLDHGTIVVLHGATRTYIESVLRPAAAITKASAPLQPRFNPTGAEQVIAGYSCEVFAASARTSQGEQTIKGCFSSSAPGWLQYRKLNERLGRRSGNNSGAIELPPGLPLSVVTSLKVRYQYSQKIAPEDRAKMEHILENRPPIVNEDVVTNVKIARLGSALFEIPSDYAKLRIAGPIEQ
jgi:hypothetical protein